MPRLHIKPTRVAVALIHDLFPDFQVFFSVIEFGDSLPNLLQPRLWRRNTLHR